LRECSGEEGANQGRRENGVRDCYSEGGGGASGKEAKWRPPAQTINQKEGNGGASTGRAETEI